MSECGGVDGKCAIIEDGFGCMFGVGYAVAM